MEKREIKQTFHKHEHLRLEKDFQKVFNGQKYKGKFINVFYIPNSLENHRVGIIVPKKVAKTAVKRNRLKRVIREFYRKNKGIIKNNYDMIIFVKGIDEKGIIQELEDFFRSV